MEEKEPRRTPRRAVLAVGAAGVAAGALAGCQVYGRPDNPPPPPPAAPPPVTPGEGGGDDADGGDGNEGGEDGTEGEGSGGAAVASTGDVAVGGGLILADQNLVITQPTQGDFKGFSATCTHQGCKVSDVTDGVIICRCHQSQYSIVDGSVVQAAQGLSPDQQAPLPAAGIAVDGDSITLA